MNLTKLTSVPQTDRRLFKERLNEKEVLIENKEESTRKFVGKEINNFGNN